MKAFSVVSLCPFQSRDAKHNGRKSPHGPTAALQFSLVEVLGGSDSYKIDYTDDFRQSENRRMSLILNGRGERIRTSDPLVPNQVRYQTALRPEL
jgi:hypothetical protein